MTDELSVKGIECFAHHGVFDFEKREGQVFVVDLVLGIDTRAAGASDEAKSVLVYLRSIQETDGHWSHSSICTPPQ